MTSSNVAVDDNDTQESDVHSQIGKLRVYDVYQTGFDLYGIERDARSATNSSGIQSATLIQQFEQRSSSFFMSLADSVSPHSPEGLYLQRLRQLTTSFARGFVSARRLLDSERELAIEIRKIAQGREAAVAQREGALRLGIQLLIIGGLSGVVARLFLGTAAGSDGKIEILMSVAVALGSMLLGMSKQLRDIARASRVIDADYYEALDLAKEKQCDRMKLVFDRTVHGFTEAYREYFQREPAPEVVSTGVEMEIIQQLRAQHDAPARLRPLGLLQSIKAGLQSLRGQTPT